jgi:oligopeptide/dipeptide ABC transporter ATP-binding protein
MSNTDYILEVNNLKKYFPLKKTMFGKHDKFVKANDGVSFKLKRGETLGIVGESGCGKSTLGRTILKLYDPTDGEIIFNGKNITDYNGKMMKELRKEMQIIFQDPYSSLNPRMTVGQIIGEAVLTHGMYKSKNAEFKKYIHSVLELCGLASYHINRFPHQFSGGQRQRIGIARALALKPSFVICDEAVSALDVSIQSQIINLFMDLQKVMNLSYLFISHDLSVVKHISDKVSVMYLGNMVEYAPKQSLFKTPLHPYTKALLSAIPSTKLNKKSTGKVLEGDIPSNVTPPPGCKFHTRCPLACEECTTKVPEWREIHPEHFVACHKVEKK